VSFLFQSLLTIGLPLVALPLVIHLINLRRHRRIEWAAMEFLLESQKRNKRWILLKQLLLMALRISAIAIVVLMLAGPVVRSGWAGLFGQGVTHHLILLDDSYSMSDHWDETSAFDEAKRVVSRVLDEARGRAERQQVTILRFSEAANLAAGAGPQFDRRPLDAQLIAELEKYLGQLTPSETGAGPIEALQAAGRLPEPTVDETRIAYLISDFRRPQWEEAAQLRQLVDRLRSRVGKLLLVAAAYDVRPNLAITRLAPEAGIRAAGVETWMEATVANYGAQPAASVTVAVEQDDAKLPALELDEIEPGGEVTHRFSVNFAGAGSHKLSASLESDAVDADNQRYFAAQIPATFPVLLVDGSLDGDDGYFLRNSLSPGGRDLAGWRVDVEPPSFLRRHEDLYEYAAICLLDVPRVDDAEAAALEAYVSSGGGLAIFLGPRAQRQFYNERLYRDGEGLFAVPLDVPAQLVRDPADASPDVQVSEHPIFRVFAGQRNSFLAVAAVDFYYAVDRDWAPPKSGDVRVLARLRNGAPFVVEKRFGAGRVVIQLCKLSPRPTEELGAWSNWSVNPVFPVFANELVGYLSAAQRRFDDHRVDQPLRVAVAEADYQPEVSVRAPGVSENGAATFVPAAKDGEYVVETPSPVKSGVWQFELKTRDGKTEGRQAAVNVPTGEGDLHMVKREGLVERLKGIDFEYSLASQFTETEDQLAGWQLSEAFLYLLIAALAAEQLLAFSASYHPQAKRGAA
jgi:hypothetical protein